MAKRKVITIRVKARRVGTRIAIAKLLEEVKAEGNDVAIHKLEKAIGIIADRYEPERGKLKLEHSVIPGLRRVLERLLDDLRIRLIIPGRIVGISGHSQLRIRVSMKTVNGWKLSATIPSAAQEVFIGTPLSKEELNEAIQKAMN